MTGATNTVHAEVEAPGAVAAADRAHQTTTYASNVCKDIDKIKAPVIASAAMVGLEVYASAVGSYIVSRWSLIKPLAGLAGVMRMVRQIGGMS